MCSGHIGGDALETYLTAESIITQGNLDLTDMRSDFSIPELKSSFDAVFNTVMQAKNEQRKYYSAYGLGMVVLNTIFYFLGIILSKIIYFVPKDYITIFLVSLINCFIVSLMVLYFYTFSFLITKSRKKSLFLSAILVFGTQLFPYAVKGGTVDPSFALGVSAATFHIYKASQDNTEKNLFYAGSWVGFALLIRFTAGMVIPIFIIFIVIALYQKKEIRIVNKILKLLYFIIPLSVLLFFYFIYNYMRFGNIFDQGYLASTAQKLSPANFLDFSINNIIARLYINLLSPGKGLIFYAPIICFSYLGFKKLYQNDKFLFGLIFSVFLIFFSFHTITLSFIGDWCWGLRYLLVVLPLLILPVNYLIMDELMYQKIKKKLIFLFILGIFIQLPAVIMNYSLYIRMISKEDINEQRYVNPQISPIIGGYYQLFSGLNRIVTGNSLTMPFDYYYYGSDRIIICSYSNLNKQRREMSLASYDQFDLWFLHIWKIEDSGVIIKIFTGVIIVLLLISSYMLYKKLTIVTYTHENR